MHKYTQIIRITIYMYLYTTFLKCVLRFLILTIHHSATFLVGRSGSRRGLITIVCFGFRSNALLVCMCVITDKYYDIKTLDLFKRICHEQTLFRGVFRFLTFCHDYFLSGFEKIKSFGQMLLDKRQLTIRRL